MKGMRWCFGDACREPQQPASEFPSRAKVPFCRKCVADEKRKRANAARLARYHARKTDPAWIERKRRWARGWYARAAAKPEFRAKEAAHRKQRYREDEAYRLKERERARITHRLERGVAPRCKGLGRRCGTRCRTKTRHPSGRCLWHRLQAAGRRRAEAVMTLGE